MKKFFTMMLLMASLTAVSFAQEVSTPEEPSAVEGVQETIDAVADSGVGFWEIVLVVVILAAILAVIAHMVYECFIRPKFREDHSVAEFIIDRHELGLSEEMSEEDYNASIDKLREIVNLWGRMPDDDGSEIPVPLKKSHITKASQLLKEVIATKPTDEEIVDGINDMHNMMNIALERKFNGSKTMIVIATIVAVVLSLITGDYHPAVMIGSGIIMYLLASRTPTFVLLRKELKNGPNHSESFLTAIFGSLFASVATAKTYKTVTTYADGHKETDTDNSETWMSLAFTAIISVILAMFLWAIAFINYLRNYVFYF